MSSIRNSKVVLCFALAFASGLVSADAPKYLEIGDPAPALKPARWLKGTPVDAFKKGEIYVVEFWATWCGPCKQNIPHLTDLAHKEGAKASIIGVSIWESNDPKNTAYLRKVSDFVDAQGEKMGYTVAADGPNAAIANAWMKQAGEGGIPTCFVIGRDGHIAWIGNPTQLEPVLDAVIAGNFDVQAARSRREVEVEITRPVDEALQAKQYAEAIRRIDEAVKKRPNLERFYTYYRLVALFHLDRTQAQTDSDRIISDSHGDIGAYRMVASILATQPGLDREAYRYGLDLVEAALKEGQMGYLFMAMKSDIYSNLGDKAGAAGAQEQAVAAAEKDSHCPPDFLQEMKGKLSKLQAASRK